MAPHYARQLVIRLPTIPRKYLPIGHYPSRPLIPIRAEWIVSYYIVITNLTEWHTITEKVNSPKLLYDQFLFSGYSIFMP